MKNNPLTAVLLLVLALSAIASVVLFWLYSQNSREIRVLRAQAAFINNRQVMLRSLAEEAVEYSKTHHDIDALLESEGIKRSAQPAPAPAAARPANK